MKVKLNWLFLAAVVVVLSLVSCASLKSDKSIADDIAKRIQDSKVTGVSVKTSNRGVTITAGELNFPADSAEITDETAQRLDALGKLLKGYENKKVLVEGHTADVGDAASQLSLSKQRANAVSEYLVSKGYMKKQNIVIEGKGGSVPLASNETEEGRKQNRRVEITLLR